MLGETGILRGVRARKTRVGALLSFLRSVATTRFHLLEQFTAAADRTLQPAPDHRSISSEVRTECTLKCSFLWHDLKARQIEHDPATTSSVAAFDRDTPHARRKSANPRYIGVRVNR
jgi:hypothetical protein